MANIWSKLGLSEKEASIYMALVELGPSTVSDISRKTGLHRPTIYQAIPTLVDRELISRSTKGSRKIFVAESPEKLKKIAGEIVREIDVFIPHLKSIYFSQEKKPIVKFLEGRKGITSVLEEIIDTLPRGSVFYRYGAIQKAEQTDKYLPSGYRERRDNKRLERLVITNEKIAKNKKPRLERLIKTIPEKEGLFDYEVTEIIYGNKVAFLDYNSETALVIENKKISDFQKSIFKSLYKRL